MRGEGSGWLLAVMAAALVAVAIALLPSPALRLARYVLGTQSPTALHTSTDPLGKVSFVPGLRVADSLFFSDGASVRRGDTLAFRQNDPYLLLREDLEGLLEGRLSPGEALVTVRQLPMDAVLRDSLSALVTGIQESAPPAGGRFTPIGEPLSRAEAELVDAEIMGAEDAIRDLRRQLNFLTPPTTADARQQAVALRKAIGRRQAFVQEQRLRMINSAAARSADSPLLPVRLTDAQRARVRNYGALLAPDTIYTISPQTGIIRLSDEDGPGRIEHTPTPAAGANGGDTTTRPPARRLPAGSYQLRPRGLPELWSTADRMDSVGVDTGRGLLVAPE